MAWTTAVSKQGKGWLLSVRGDGVDVEYRYTSLKQARFFAAVISLGPKQLPPPPVAPTRRRARSERNAVRTPRRAALLEESLQHLGWAEERLQAVTAGELVAALRGAC